MLGFMLQPNLQALFFVGRVKRQRNPTFITFMLGYGFATLRERTSTQPTS
jgi:hypothetical protein